MRIPHFSGDVYLCRLKKTDIIMITTSRFFKEKQYMWYKVRELQSKGLNKTQIGKHLGVDRSTVRKYLQMSREDFVRRRNSHRKYTLKLAGYEEYVRNSRVPPMGRMRRQISGRNGCPRKTAEARKSIFLRSSWHVHATSSPVSAVALSTRSSPSMHTSAPLSISEGNRKRSFMTRTGC